MQTLFSPKYGALACLVLQNTFLVVFMRISRTADGNMYASSTAVVVMEVVKFITCILVVLYNTNGLTGAWKAIYAEIICQPVEVLKLAIPSLLYTIQNNLLYYALSNLDAATFQVGYQIKILTTAIFSVIMLNRHLSRLQWFSLIILTIGVAMAQYSSQSNVQTRENSTSGFIAVLLAAISSGFSGVYFERILKNSGTSLWMRNIQMGMSSIILGFVGVYGSGELPGVWANGFFHGYTHMVWTVIALQAIGGLVVAVVVKYADNILKGFAAAFSILTSCALCYFLLDFHPNLIFLSGATLVSVSMYLYSYQPSHKTKSGDEIGSGDKIVAVNRSESSSSKQNNSGSSNNSSGGGSTKSGGGEISPKMSNADNV